MAAKCTHQNRSETEAACSIKEKHINRNCQINATRTPQMGAYEGAVLSDGREEKAESDWESVLLVVCSWKLMLRWPDRVCFCSLQDCYQEWPGCLLFPTQRLCHCQQSTWHTLLKPETLIRSWVYVQSRARPITHSRVIYGQVRAESQYFSPLFATYSEVAAAF